MDSKVLVALCVLVAVATAVPAGPAAAGWPPAGGPFGGVGGWGGGGVWGGAGGWGGAGAVNPWIPPWVATAPWIPAWAPCTTIGSACLDCNTKVICTKIGGIEKACSDPTLPHCNLGECSATPSAECAAPAVPASAGAA